MQIIVVFLPSLFQHVFLLFVWCFLCGLFIMFQIFCTFRISNLVALMIRYTLYHLEHTYLFEHNDDHTISLASINLTMSDMMAIFLPPTCPIIILTCHLILGRIYVKTTGDNYIMSVNSSLDLEHMLGKSNMIYIGNYFKLKKIICIHINNHIYNANF